MTTSVGARADRPIRRRSDSPRFIVRLFNGCALFFHTRDYWTEDDDKATTFGSEQEATQRAVAHRMRPGQFTVEKLEGRSENAERGSR